ncbi:chalcone isomerase family protein [Roseiconus nitratireducens]|uniref:chalcone isomerase family protein n=1 Tax=Roseiconus nitratireducens TaxID=2605748 RepID=UPI001F26C34A|nr:chalcone isomerase family protein [Roseiconus nitratireducens]
MVLVVAATIGNRAAAADFPAQIKAGEHRLLLNGWGARTKFYLEMYVAGLYLTKTNSDPAAIAAANEPMSIRVKITSGMVSQAKMVQSLTDGFHNATGGNVASIQPEINQFRKCLTEAITKGDTFDFVYLPEHGVMISKNGKLKGVVAGIEFKKALFNIWLSDKPADANLKKAMLTRSLRR